MHRPQSIVGDRLSFSTQSARARFISLREPEGARGALPEDLFCPLATMVARARVTMVVRAGDTGDNAARWGVGSCVSPGQGFMVAVPGIAVGLGYVRSRSKDFFAFPFVRVLLVCSGRTR